MPALPLYTSSIYCVITVGKHLYACLTPVYLYRSAISAVCSAEVQKQFRDLWCWARLW